MVFEILFIIKGEYRYWIEENGRFFNLQTAEYFQCDSTFVDVAEYPLRAQ